jgi:hypothetical protein
MYARVVRFTDVSPERIAEIDERVEEEGGPPPDVPAKTLQVIVDEHQSTAVVILFFDSEEDMRKGDQVLNAMDAGDTPGTRASVDQGEVKVERDT